MMNRYNRQITLPEIGPEGQKKISNASVLCVGAGGLGSPALLYLAAAGIGTLGVADFDVVDESNLQRQVLFTTDQTSEPKTTAAKEKLEALNPDIKIEIHPEGLNANNAEILFSAYDIILDGTDNFSAKFLINDAGVKFKKPFIYGAIQGFDGQAAVFDAARGPCYRCLYPEPPTEQIQNCAEAGVIGAVAGTIGVTQAMQTIILVTGHQSFKPLIGKLWTIDMRNMETRLLDIPKNLDCPVCSKKTEEIELIYKEPICTNAIEEIALTDLQSLGTPMLVDVREHEEWDQGHIPDAIHFPFSKILQGKIENLPNDRPLVLYCQKGMRSRQAAETLIQSGKQNILCLKECYDTWHQESKIK